MRHLLTHGVKILALAAAEKITPLAAATRIALGNLNPTRSS